MAGEGDYIDPQIPAQDFDDLQTKTKSVRDWVNRSVAHLSTRSRKGPPLNDVHDAIDVVADLFRKYHTLIMGVTVQLGVILEPWPTVFRVPWNPDDDQYREVMARMGPGGAKVPREAADLETRCSISTDQLHLEPRSEVVVGFEIG